MRKLRNGEGNLSKIETAIINARLKDTTWSIQELDRLVAIVQAMGPHRSALLKQFPDKPYLSIRWQIEKLRKKQKDQNNSVPAHRLICQQMCKYWTKAEDQRLKQGIKLYGNDYRQVAKHVRTRTNKQVYRRARYAVTHIKGFENLQIKKYKNWTDDEKDAFVKLFKKHGPNKEILKKAFPNRSDDWSGVVRRIRVSIEKEPNHKYAHMKDVFKSQKAKWTAQDD